MKSFFKILCLVLALTSTAGIAVAKDTAATPINKAEFANKVVNLNKADANTLRYYLKGIGEVKAEAIIQYRKDNGKFSSAADLLKVSGIGEATFKGLKKNVSTSRGETSAPKLPTAGAKSKANSSKKSSKKSPSLLDKADEKKEAAKGKTAKKDDTSNSKTKAKKAKSEDDAAKKKAKSKKTSSKAAKCDPKKDKACKSKASKKKSTAKTKKRTSKPKTTKKTAKKE